MSRHYAPGDLVCDCRNLHLRVREAVLDDTGDQILTLEDGASCSVRHCGIELAAFCYGHPVLDLS